jgi:hypothetical protein
VRRWLTGVEKREQRKISREIQQQAVGLDEGGR